MHVLTSFLVTAISVVLTDGSAIRLNVNPETFTPLLTKYMSLTCAFGDASPATDGADQSQTRSFRASSQLRFVTSIVISREGNDIASISEHFPATSLADLGSIKVNGSLAGSAGELSLTWSHPSSTQEGNYTCKVTGLDQMGHIVTFFGAAFIKQSLPTISDLVNRIYSQELAVEVLESVLHNQTLTISVLESKVREQELNMSALESKINGQEQKNFVLESKVQDQERKNNVLESRLTDQEHCCLKLDNTTSVLGMQLNHQETNLERLEMKSNQTDESLHRELEVSEANNNRATSELLGKIHILEANSTGHQADLITQLKDMQKNISDNSHIESGVVNCGPLGSGSLLATGQSYNDTAKYIQVNFKSPYPRTPYVAVATKDVFVSRDYTASYYMYATRVTPRGFTVHCYSASSSYYVAYLYVTWISHL